MHTCSYSVCCFRRLQVIFKANDDSTEKPTIEFNGEVDSPRPQERVLTYVRMS